MISAKTLLALCGIQAVCSIFQCQPEKALLQTIILTFTTCLLPVYTFDLPLSLARERNSETQSCAWTKYRSFDGSCNNLETPSLGTPFKPFKRLLPPDNSEPNPPLPKTREISMRLFPDMQQFDSIWNLNCQPWGQFLAHDLSLHNGVLHDLVTCCEDDTEFIEDSYDRCDSIVLPQDDPFYTPRGNQCMFYPTPKTHWGGPPLSQVTAYMDLSLVYGCNSERNNKLRAWHGGRLLSTFREGREWPPHESDVKKRCRNVRWPDEPCHLSGDDRTNQNTPLTLMHIIMFREHNRIADALNQINPHWSDETIFQEARRIHIAQFQHINYYEYLPIFLGYDNMVKNKLIHPDNKSYVNDYNCTVDPSIAIEHATAAHRHFHSLILGYIQLMSENRESLGDIRLSTWLNRPLVLELGDNFNDMTRGLTAQHCSAADQFHDNEITEYIFRRNFTYGGDLKGLDIQRGRDHRLAKYVQLRHECGLTVPETFEDMLDYMSQEVSLLIAAIDWLICIINLSTANIQHLLLSAIFIISFMEEFVLTPTLNDK